jgi:hypothetical protein
VFAVIDRRLNNSPELSIFGGHRLLRLLAAALTIA